jgi:heme/copper-type cytochrome/quinol oxidase subunit 4
MPILNRRAKTKIAAFLSSILTIIAVPMLMSETTQKDLITKSIIGGAFISSIPYVGNIILSSAMHLVNFVDSKSDSVSTGFASFMLVSGITAVAALSIAYSKAFSFFGLDKEPNVAANATRQEAAPAVNPAPRARLEMNAAPAVVPFANLQARRAATLVREEAQQAAPAPQAAARPRIHSM